MSFTQHFLGSLLANMKHLPYLGFQIEMAKFGFLLTLLAYSGFDFVPKIDYMPDLETFNKTITYIHIDINYNI